ncbi:MULTISPECIES: GNAT family N-acetyltransferase [unclassified Bradyrhizobium]|uniref:GNAT family N-acetyltransferase n=1 Tax=unclassified Bradyrhizobium TaxID=2631580 RepID=UPI0020B347A0|nr:MULTISPECIES: GNAT family N-acetyltransferase [unclassified Bradyrhizobium]MCP3402142.1 N-acetyltransferase [Bradyrhizobium sp. CCGB20]MCP3410632.1 N-acetyltransferase [Bradyrhizobium sp. CCGB01]
MNSVRDNVAEHRFELAIDGSGELAAAYYRPKGDRIVLTHTEVPERFAGHGVASELARGVFEALRRAGRKAILVCPFMTAFYARHPEYSDVVDDTAQQEKRL